MIEYAIKNAVMEIRWRTQFWDKECDIDATSFSKTFGPHFIFESSDDWRVILVSNITMGKKGHWNWIVLNSPRRAEERV